MSPRSLGLTDEQLADIRSAAARVPHKWRPRFLEAVADRLAPVGFITNQAVHAAISSALRRMGAA